MSVYLISRHKFGREFVFVGGVRHSDKWVIVVVHDGVPAAPRRDGHRSVVSSTHDALRATTAHVSQLIVGFTGSTRGQLQRCTNNDQRQ